ncbi:MAG: hypothetical protein DRP71_10005 [Verrucomicrobia bacterium]|nr:MAG: hypothetical protein DRP71_10005 [Verrucomicrobiota bacterium]
MNKTIVALIVTVAVALAAFFGYRSVQATKEREVETRRATELTAEISAIRLAEKEALKRAEVDAEARRLAGIKARQEAEAEAVRLAEVEALREREEAARRRAEADAAEAVLALALLAEEKSVVEDEVRRLADLRLQEAKEAEERFLAAERALRESEEETKARQAEIDRQAALLDSLHRRQQAESIVVDTEEEIRQSRFVYPVDYKRGNHYRITVP